MTPETKLLLRSVIANVPYVGNVAVETMSYQSEQEATLDIDRRFQVLAEAIVRLAASVNVPEIEELLATHGYTRLHKRLASFYFNNGCDPHHACRVFLHAWHVGAFDDLDLLSPQDKVSTLRYILQQFFVNAIGYKGSPKIPLDEYRMLIALATNFINAIDQTKVRYIDVAAIFVLLGHIHLKFGTNQFGALCLMKGIENAVSEGANLIPTGDGNTGTAHALESVVSALGVAFMNMRLLQLARHAFLVSTKMQETLKRGGGPELDNAFWLGHLFAMEGNAATVVADTAAAVSYYRRFLKLGDGSLEWLRQHEDHYLWGRREVATRYVMENEVPKPEKIGRCLCGYSDLPYLECCSFESSSPQSNIAPATSAES